MARRKRQPVQQIIQFRSVADIEVGVFEHGPEGAGRQAGPALEILEAPPLGGFPSRTIR